MSTELESSNPNIIVFRTIRAYSCHSTILNFTIFKQTKNIPLIVSGFVGEMLILNQLNPFNDKKLRAILKNYFLMKIYDQCLHISNKLLAFHMLINLPKCQSNQLLFLKNTAFYKKKVLGKAANAISVV